MKSRGPFLEVVSGAGEPDAEVEQLLGAARRWVEPSQENRERVSAGLRGSLSGLSASSAVPRALWPSDVAPPGAAHSNVPPAKAGRTARLGRAPWLLVGGALIGALGFWLGHGVGYGTGERVAAARAGGELAGAPAPALALPPMNGALEQESREATAPELARPARPAHAPPVPDPTSMPAASTAAASNSMPSASPPRAHRSVPRAPRAASAAPSAEPSRMSFRQVLDQLRRAQQQLRSGQATMSLMLLSELDRRAGDVLLEERNATRVLALCAEGHDEAARDVARRLENDSPRSIYGMRLEASCISDPAPVESSAREKRAE